MAANDIVSVILHYKRNIDKISVPPERALKYEDRVSPLCYFLLYFVTTAHWDVRRYYIF